jgi:hypothetical protein
MTLLLSPAHCIRTMLRRHTDFDGRAGGGNQAAARPSRRDALHLSRLSRAGSLVHVRLAPAAPSGGVQALPPLHRRRRNQASAALQGALRILTLALASLLLLGGCLTQEQQLAQMESSDKCQAARWHAAMDKQAAVPGSGQQDPGFVEKEKLAQREAVRAACEEWLQSLPWWEPWVAEDEGGW